MSWQPEVDEIHRRHELAKKLGGEKAVAKHHEAGKLTVRERIERLIDQGSFKEYGLLTGSAKYD